ncbi:hypothetical protein ACVIGB_005874 [Bradyrhizobium sp. USDA 4341]
MSKPLNGSKWRREFCGKLYCRTRVAAVDRHRSEGNDADRRQNNHDLEDRASKDRSHQNSIDPAGILVRVSAPRSLEHHRQARFRY